MREIKFRGQCILTGEWLYGGLIQLENVTRISWTNENDVFCSAVIKEDTLSQYTGLKDKNGNEICEGDVVKVRNKSGVPGSYYVGDVVFDKAFFGYRAVKRYGSYPASDVFTKNDVLTLIVNPKTIEIIGNIYEHGYLLEVSE